MKAFSLRLPIVLMTLSLLQGNADVFSSRVFAQVLPATQPGSQAPAGAPRAASPRPHELWCNTQPVPNAAAIRQLKGVEFAVIQSRAPEQDGYSWLHGVALAWHRGQLYASFGRNRGEENTATEEALVRISQDGGRSWGPVSVIDDGLGEREAVSHGVFLLSEERLWALQGGVAVVTPAERAYQGLSSG